MTLRDLFQALGWGVVHSAWLLTVVWALWRARLVGARSGEARHRFAALALIVCCAAHLVSVGAGGFLPLMRPYAAAGAFTSHAALGDAIAAPLVVSPAAQWYMADLVLIIGVLWTAWAAAGLLRLAGGIVLARSRYLHRCRPASPASRALVLDVAAQRGIHAPIRVLESATVGSPAMLGVLRPAIVLPAGGLEHLTPAQRRGVVAHEVEHVGRGDARAALAQGIVEAFLGFHPAVRSMSTSLRVEREHLCDAAAARVCGSAHAYVEALLNLEECREGPSLALAARRGCLLDRARWLLAPETATQAVRGALARAAAVGALAGGFALVALPAAIHVAAATPSRVAEYTVAAADPAGSFTLLVRRGRAVTVDLGAGPIATARLAHVHDSVVVRRPDGTRDFAVRLLPRGGIAWAPRPNP